MGSDENSNQGFNIFLFTFSNLIVNFVKSYSTYPLVRGFVKEDFVSFLSSLHLAFFQIRASD